MKADVFCTLHIRSGERSSLPARFFRPVKETGLVFKDLHAEAALARRARLREQLGLDDVALPRYYWRLCTENRVAGDDIHDHIQWLLACVRDGHRLLELKEAGYAYWLSVFWTGNGTGGGPLIDLPTVHILAREQISMGIGFYLACK